ncbi:hypothetical protein HAP48_0042630 [Bradyrhizobium septentrionale]|uniref:Uncharacterized protein n=1 Tax=Bradyrhizobium septentrionale TaxID=1404411 RepID=A0A974A375_9BRAD|nr:hypothetical protein [Bradyrhizobium septentrionale]UGY15156.1 hypothetical protein HAP48_0042630 [Bradyrhizobium septentrionale]
MAFEEIETVTKTNQPPMAKLTYMRPKVRGTGQSKPGTEPQLMVSIPTTVCGAAKAERYVLQLGTGDDLGKIRITGSTSEAAIKPRELMHAFVFSFGYVPRLGDDMFDDERGVVRKIDDSTFEIKVAASLFPPAPGKSK